MRSRPGVALYLRPAVASAGQIVRAEVELHVRSVTPTEFVDVWLLGKERRARADEGGGDLATIVTRKARFTPGSLEKGRRRFAATFELPADAPPSYSGTYYGVEYAFEVHVAIPWWPDRHARFTLPVIAEPASRTAPQIQVWSSSTDGPVAKRPYLEVSLGSERVTPGETIDGTIAVTNSSAMRALEVAFVAREQVDMGGRPFETEVQRLVARLPKARADGVGVPFRVRLPKEAPATFVTRGVKVRWELQVRAVVRFGDDVVMNLPIVVSAPDKNGVPESNRRRATIAAPVGRERRALLWRAVAEQLELRNDAHRERMEGAFGGVSVVVRLEQRPDGELFVIGDCSFRPPLSLGLVARERRWLDALGKAGLAPPGPLADRLFVEAREPDHARALLAGECARALAALEEVSLDDNGAELGNRASVQSVEALVARVAPLVAAAQALGEARERLPGAGATYR